VLDREGRHHVERYGYARARRAAGDGVRPVVAGRSGVGVGRREQVSGDAVRRLPWQCRPAEFGGGSDSPLQEKRVVMLVSGQTLLDEAVRGGYAVGSFNTYNLEITKAIIAAAEARKASIFLSVGG